MFSFYVHFVRYSVASLIAPWGQIKCFEIEIEIEKAINLKKLVLLVFDMILNCI